MTSERTQVAIVGAGVAGLTLAARLLRGGVTCRIYEQAEEIRAVGAGIQLSPNATRLLHRMGADLAATAVEPEAIEMRRWDDSALVARTELGAACRAEYGAPYYCVHRADLHRALMELVPAETVVLGARCVAARGSELIFADGSSVVADVVVGADGIRSVIRSALLTDSPRFSGQAVYRGLVPAERVRHVLPARQVTIWLGPGRHAVCYPISGGKVISFVATTPAGAWRTESWTSPGEVRDVLAAYEGWSDALRTVLSSAGAVTRWALYDRDAVPRWSGERITLVGDAAHPMLPFGAQGANQAIEDAVVLAACLAAAPVPDALRRYERLRRPRVRKVHATMRENARNHHYADGDRQRDRDAHAGARWGLKSQAWLYGYDADVPEVQ